MEKLYYKSLLRKIGVAPKNKNPYGWFGDYPSWEAASADTAGYQQANILEKTKQSLSRIKSGQAVYERDSVLFSQKEYPYPLISCLLHIASAHGNTLHVVDFGGSLGSSFYQIKDFLTHLEKISWHVVEQPNYVSCGKAEFEDDILKFDYTLKDGIKACRPHVVLLSSVVQYLPEPHRFLSELARQGVEYIIFDRTSFADSGKDRLTVQHVNPSIYQASYPCWFFNQDDFLRHFDQYSILAEFSSYVPSETILCIDGKPQAKDKGFFLKIKP
ncbi:methyltransferase, TIGR04325 family [Dyadobacter psychrotolerans]|uniref:methyltransferase, TIGR04325 family n=1 Tax=Dyadobacter psychrotolerans TaxID=2541721 RepID=UPI001E4EC640|nr:methyltransferase, TIGR04325 family [Dyadobacter psychrotolerans]